MLFLNNVSKIKDGKEIRFGRATKLNVLCDTLVF